ncbi:MAG: hypothetical protein K0Q90_1656 [Paenibacillaceae bacterium]|nr:hypothetical protein [Paenibacillaceae bacterium]
MPSIHLTPALSQTVRNTKVEQISCPEANTTRLLLTPEEKKQLAKVTHRNVRIFNNYETAGDNWS